MAKTRRPERSLIPAGVTLIQGAAKAFDPDKNSVVLETGDALIRGQALDLVPVQLHAGTNDKVVGKF